MIRIYGKDDDGMYAKAAAAVFQHLSLSGQAAIELDFFSPQEIAALNLGFRNNDSVTDVLSFPMLKEIRDFNKINYPLDTDENGEVFVGSIVICSQVAEENAKEYGHSTQRELSYLFVHGLLHLLGYDHILPQDKLIMREKEEEILAICNQKR